MSYVIACPFSLHIVTLPDKMVIKIFQRIKQRYNDTQIGKKYDIRRQDVTKLRLGRIKCYEELWKEHFPNGPYPAARTGFLVWDLDEILDSIFVKKLNDADILKNHRVSQSVTSQVRNGLLWIEEKKLYDSILKLMHRSKIRWKQGTCENLTVCANCVAKSDPGATTWSKPWSVAGIDARGIC